MGVIDLVDYVATLFGWLLLFGMLGSVVLYIPAYWCFQRAGWSGWWFVALALPVVGLVVLWCFAFGYWPKEHGEEQS